jgi:hypothetical protein
VRGRFGATGQRLRSVGITCALCHSVVDNSFAPGIGRRLDGWAARDLNVGAIIALSPNVQPFVDLLGLIQPAIDANTVRTALRSWGPGKFDAERTGMRSLPLSRCGRRPHPVHVCRLMPASPKAGGINVAAGLPSGRIALPSSTLSKPAIAAIGNFAASAIRGS